MLWSLNARITDPSPWHAHTLFEFALCRAPGGRLETEGGDIALCEGRTILIPPGIRHRYVMAHGEECHLKLVCLTPQDITTFLSPAQGAMLNESAMGGVSVADHPSPSRIALLGDLITDGLDVIDSGTRQINWGAMGLLLALHAKEKHLAQDHALLRYKAKIREVVSWIEDNLDGAVTLERVALDFAMSRSLLIREFRRHTGKSLIEYCNQRRVEKAGILLATTPTPVAEAALQSGFANLSHFHRRFKAYYGLTPASFRRKIAEEGGRMNRSGPRGAAARAAACVEQTRAQPA